MQCSLKTVVVCRDDKLSSARLGCRRRCVPSVGHFSDHEYCRCSASRINVSRRYARITAYCRRREPSPSQHAIIADYTHDVAVHDRTFAPPGYLPHQTPVPSHENYDLEHLHPG